MRRLVGVDGQGHACVAVLGRADLKCARRRPRCLTTSYLRVNVSLRDPIVKGRNALAFGYHLCVCLPKLAIVQTLFLRFESGWLRSAICIQDRMKRVQTLAKIMLRTHVCKTHAKSFG